MTGVPRRRGSWRGNKRGTDMSLMAEKVPKLKLVDFELPFVLNVGDSCRDESLEEWAQAVREGREPPPSVHASPKGNIGSVHLPTIRHPPYTIALPGGLVVRMCTLRRVNQQRAVKIHGEVPGDRAGKASFTSVRVMIDLAQVPADLHWHMEHLCGLSVDAANHLIDWYRVVADRPFLRRVTPALVHEFRLITVFDDDSTDPPPRLYVTGSGPMQTFGAGLEARIDSQLRTAVAQAEPPPIGAILDADVRSHLEQREWRLAVIQVAVLFEAWLHRFVRARFARKRIPSADIEAKFLRADGVPKSATSIAKSLVKEATGFDFSATAEYRSWEKKVRDLRNDLVHGARFDVTQTEATEACDAAAAAIALMETK